MKLLLDQNLSPRLASRLDDLFPGTLHVRDVGLEAADDNIVWQFAMDNGFCITSKDADFHQISPGRMGEAKRNPSQQSCEVMGYGINRLHPSYALRFRLSEVD